MFVMMVSSVILLAVTALYMTNIKLHNLSLTRGNITHIVQHQHYPQNYSEMGQTNYAPQQQQRRY